MQVNSSITVQCAIEIQRNSPQTTWFQRKTLAGRSIYTHVDSVREAVCTRADYRLYTFTPIGGACAQVRLHLTLWGQSWGQPLRQNGVRIYVGGYFKPLPAALRQETWPLANETRSVEGWASGKGHSITMGLSVCGQFRVFSYLGGPNRGPSAIQNLHYPHNNSCRQAQTRFRRL